MEVGQVWRKRAPQSREDLLSPRAQVRGPGSWGRPVAQQGVLAQPSEVPEHR